MGLPPLTYQWRKDGVDLEEETAPMLALDVLTPGDEGAYTVIIQSSTGETSSDPANLWVPLNESQPRMLSPGRDMSSRFQMTLQGELGRSYRLESSTNLVTWTDESFYSEFPSRGPIYSVVRATNTAITLTLPTGSAGKYFRAARYVPPNEQCINQLKQIQFATEIWALEFNLTLGSVSSTAALAPYFKGGLVPRRCPEGGFHVHGSVSGHPSCTLPTHPWEEPR
jgi:hypothetical protein